MLGIQAPKQSNLFLRLLFTGLFKLLFDSDYLKTIRSNSTIVSQKIALQVKEHEE